MKFCGKLLLMLVWPLLAGLILVMALLMCVAVWMLIPFGTLKRDDKGALKFTFPWGDKP